MKDIKHINIFKLIKHHCNIVKRIIGGIFYFFLIFKEFLSVTNGAIPGKISAFLFSFSIALDSKYTIFTEGHSKGWGNGIRGISFIFFSSPKFA